MSTHARALLIGSLGPALQAVGLVWVLLNAVLSSGRVLTLRYIVFDPAHLVIFAGIVVSVVCIPVAIQVARAAPEDMKLALFEPAQVEQRSELPIDISGETSEMTE